MPLNPYSIPGMGMLLLFPVYQKRNETPKKPRNLAYTCTANTKSNVDSEVISKSTGLSILPVREVEDGSR